MAENAPNAKTTSQNQASATVGQRVRNLSIVLVAAILSVAMFLGLRAQSGTATLDAQAKQATPWVVAASNDKPTLMEFYADWCTICQAIAPEMDAVKQQYGDRVNFVMLNVDNSKWLPEILQYGVNGIPHFIFLDRSSETVASAIGELPRSVMEANLEALIAENPLPYSSSSSQMSPFEAPVAPNKPSADDPRSHGSQVVQD